MRRLVWLGLVFVLGACDGGGPALTAPPPPDLTTFMISPTLQTAIDTQLMDGESAGGDYTLDEMTGDMTLHITASTYACDGPSAGFMADASVVSVDATTLVWMVDGDTMTLTRVDETGGTGLEGVWQDTDQTYFVFAPMGMFTVVGPAVVCDRPRNGDGCYELGLSGASITVDGELSDWDAVDPSARITDERGDLMGTTVTGADIRSLAVEVQNDMIFVHLDLFDAPNESFGADGPNRATTYQIHMRGDGGDWIWEFYYDENDMAWKQQRGDSQATIGVGANGFEFGFPLLPISQSVDIPLIRAEVRDCGTMGQPCVRYDEIDSCGALDGL